MDLFEKYAKFLDEDVRAGAKEVNSVDLAQFQFGAEYEFVIPFDKFSETANNAIERARNGLKNTLGVNISDDMSIYTTQNDVITKYRLVTDQSVKSQTFDDFWPLEFITPVIPYNKFSSVTETLFKFIEANGYETSGTAGLHVGISFKDSTKTAEINPLKLVLFSSDQFFRNSWPRIREKLDSGELSQDYVKSNISMIQKIIKRVVYYSSEKKQDITSENIAELVNEWLDAHTKNWFSKDPEWRGKHYAVNIGKLTDGYVEFRVLGGKDYHKRFNEVEYSVKRFCLSLIQSTSQSTNRDYLKKLYKILNTVLDDLEDFDKMDTGQEDTKIKLSNKKAIAVLNRSEPLFTDNLKLKEFIYNMAKDFENSKAGGINMLLHLLTQDFGGIKYKALLRTLLASIVRIYGVTKADIKDQYDEHYFEPGQIPEKPEDEDEPSDYWDYADGIKNEHKISSANVIKIVGL